MDFRNSTSTYRICKGGNRSGRPSRAPAYAESLERRSLYLFNKLQCALGRAFGIGPFALSGVAESLPHLRFSIYQLVFLGRILLFIDRFFERSDRVVARLFDARRIAHSDKPE